MDSLPTEQIESPRDFGEALGYRSSNFLPSSPAYVAGLAIGQRRGLDDTDELPEPDDVIIASGAPPGLAVQCAVADIGNFLSGSGALTTSSTQRTGAMKLLHGRASDLTTEIWSMFAGALRDLSVAHTRFAAVQEEKVRRHVRARRAEEAEDNLFDAETHAVYVQKRFLGVVSAELDVGASVSALASAVAASAFDILLLTKHHQPCLPVDVWHLILRGVLPLQKFGFAPGPCGDNDLLIIALTCGSSAV